MPQTAPIGGQRSGLSAAQAAQRLADDGPNELPKGQGRPLWRIARDIVTEPMFALLLGAGAIYLVLGDLGEALILLIFACLSVAIAIIQENRSERMLDALRDLTAPRAIVIRDGERRTIPGREVVRGDLLVVSEGDRVAADGHLVLAGDVMADESILTGESVPVRKIAREDTAQAADLRPGGDDLPAIFSGTLIVRGQGVALVTATGVKSEMGKIGAALREIETVPPRLTLQTRRLVQFVAIAGLSVTLLMVALFGLMRGDWLQATLGGIALGMSMLPEEFPLVLTVFMVMGAWRISRVGVLTRRSSAIETLGSATVLCTDKTGTLTENRMTIVELRIAQDSWRPRDNPAQPLPDHFAPLVECGILASAAEPFDPMEKAFYTVQREHLAHRAHPHDDRIEAHEWGLSDALLAVTKAWTSTRGDDHMVAAKGAPEAIARLCRLDAAARARVQGDVEAMAQRGLRVLAIARADLDAPPREAGVQNFASPLDFAAAFSFIGLVGLADPLRPQVPEAIAQCRSAGIRVVMITGDHPVTARAIAQDAGLAVDLVLTGEDLERTGDEALAEMAGRVTVFARINPIQKLRIVEAFKARGDVVAMTGDGVNDAPSLKAANIGVAMGKRGTDVAREAASIVLLDDDFLSIVRTIALGRRIYDNLRKAMGYIVALHVPIGGVALLPLLTGMPIMFAPIHIAFLEMVIDPVCSIVFEGESEERDIMRRPPRAPDSPLFSRGLVIWSLLQGLVAFAATAGVYVLAMARGMGEEDVRAQAFVTLVLTNLVLIAVNRSFASSLLDLARRPNRSYWMVLGAVIPLLVLIVNWGPAERLFGFGTLGLGDLAICIAAALGVLGLLELLKGFWRARLAA